MSTREQPGTVFTFYSFKGGVGRTMVLANIGVTLCRWGYRVLLIDWDLEAPGLDRYLKPLHAGALQGGVVDLLHDSAPESVGWRSFVVKLQPGEDLGDASLDFLPAGGSVGDYAERVQRLDVRDLYRNDQLGNRLERLRDEWKQAYDLILIDSRTGISDVGGICTVQLPDTLCLCFTTNEQSFYGALDVARRANQQRALGAVDRGQMMVLPLVTRFESAVEYSLAQSWEERIAEGIAESLQSWVPEDIQARELVAHLRVPYVAHWSFGEGLPALEDDPQDPLSVAYAIETIAALVARNLGEPGLLAANRQLYVNGADQTGLAGRRRSSLFTSDFAVHYEQHDGTFARQLIAALGDRGFKAVGVSLGGSLEDGEDATPAAQHAIFIVGSAPPARLLTSVRQLLLELIEPETSEAPRFLVPVVHAEGGARRLPPTMRNLQWIDAWQKPLSTVVDELSGHVGRQIPAGSASVVQAASEPSLDLDVWFSESLGRFNSLLEQKPQFTDRYDMGFWEVGYAFEPSPRIDAAELRRALISSVRGETGWPEWLWADWRGVKPMLVDGAIECWLAEENAPLSGGSHSDFWRASQQGQTYLLRGYEEDDELGSLERGTTLDLTIPIWRMGEALLHASGMATELSMQGAFVRFRAQWKSLRGRRLVALSSRRFLHESRVATQDKVRSEITVAAAAVEDSLAEAVFRVLKPLYVVFDFFELPFAVVEEELSEMRTRSR